MHGDASDTKNTPHHATGKAEALFAVTGDASTAKSNKNQPQNNPSWFLLFPNTYHDSVLGLFTSIKQSI